MHTILHYLDDLRGAFGLSTFSWNSVRGNIGAIPWQFALLSPITVLLWPRAREWCKRFLAKHVTKPLKDHTTRLNKGVHEKLDAHHAEILEQAERHHQEKLDQAERHHRAHLQAVKSAGKPKTALRKVTHG